jgi:hypothetical protein
MNVRGRLIPPCSAILLRICSAERRSSSPWLSSILTIDLMASISFMATRKFAVRNRSEHDLVGRADRTMFHHSDQKILSGAPYVVTQALEHIDDRPDGTHVNHGSPEVLCVESVSPAIIGESLIAPCSTILLRRYSVVRRALSLELSSILTVDLTASASIIIA